MVRVTDGRGIVCWPNPAATLLVFIKTMYASLVQLHVSETLVTHDDNDDHAWILISSGILSHIHTFTIGLHMFEIADLLYVFDCVR